MCIYRERIRERERTPHTHCLCVVCVLCVWCVYSVDIVFSTHSRECPSAICIGGILSIQSVECLLYREESVPPHSLCRGESVSSTPRRDCNSVKCRGESVSLLYREERDYFSLQRRVCLSLPDREDVSVQKRECLLYTEERLQLCYM